MVRILTSLVWLKHPRQLWRDVDRVLSVGASDVDEHTALFIGAIQGIVDVGARVTGILLASITQLLAVYLLVTG